MKTWARILLLAVALSEIAGAETTHIEVEKPVIVDMATAKSGASGGSNAVAKVVGVGARCELGELRAVVS